MGKSTIINLLNHCCEAVSGAITVDGVDVRTVTRIVRQQIGVVLQDNFLFSGSVADNIRYGRLDTTDEEVEAAAKVVGAHDFIVDIRWVQDKIRRKQQEPLAGTAAADQPLARAVAIADPVF